MSITAISSVQLANNGAAFLQTVPTSAGGNWVQSTVTANLAATPDWMDPTSSGPDAVSLAANAFAAAEQISASNRNTIAVNTGISVLSKQLTGEKVNVLA